MLFASTGAPVSSSLTNSWKNLWLSSSDEHDTYELNLVNQKNFFENDEADSLKQEAN